MKPLKSTLMNISQRINNLLENREIDIDDTEGIRNERIELEAEIRLMTNKIEQHRSLVRSRRFARSLTSLRSFAHVASLVRSRRFARSLTSLRSFAHSTGKSTVR